jgi:hypothetical protein
MCPKRGPTPRRTGRLTVGHKITSTSKLADLRKAALSMVSKNWKLQTRLLVREGAPHLFICDCLKVINTRNWSESIAVKSRSVVCSYDCLVYVRIVRPEEDNLPVKVDDTRIYTVEWLALDQHYSVSIFRAVIRYLRQCLLKAVRGGAETETSWASKLPALQFAIYWLTIECEFPAEESSARPSDLAARVLAV